MIDRWWCEGQSVVGAGPHSHTIWEETDEEVGEPAPHRPTVSTGSFFFCSMRPQLLICLEKSLSGSAYPTLMSYGQDGKIFHIWVFQVLMLSDNLSVIIKMTGWLTLYPWNLGSVTFAGRIISPHGTIKVWPECVWLQTVGVQLERKHHLGGQM